MDKFGWSYPAGCNSVPVDEDVHYPSKDDIIRLGDLKGIVLDVYLPSSSEPPEWYSEEREDKDILVALEGEDEPRAASVLNLAPDKGPLVHPDWDHCHCIGDACDTSGVTYFDAKCYGGAWYATTTWDGAHCTFYLTTDDGPYESERAALLACSDAALDAIGHSEWRRPDWLDPETVARIDALLAKQRDHWWSQYADGEIETRKEDTCPT